MSDDVIVVGGGLAGLVVARHASCRRRARAVARSAPGFGERLWPAPFVVHGRLVEPGRRAGSTRGCSELLRAEVDVDGVRIGARTFRCVAALTHWCRFCGRYSGAARGGRQPRPRDRRHRTRRPCAGTLEKQRDVSVVERAGTMPPIRRCVTSSTVARVHGRRRHGRHAGLDAARPGRRDGDGVCALLRPRGGVRRRHERAHGCHRGGPGLSGRA